MLPNKVRPLREAIVAGLVVFAIAGAGISYIAHEVTESQSEIIRTDLIRTARAAASLVDAELHERVIASGTVDDPAYRQLVLPLARFHSGVPEIAYLYTLVARDGRLAFGLDTAHAPDVLGFNRPMEASDVLEPYASDSPEEDAAELAALLAGRTYVSSKPFTDAFGKFLSALAPVRAPDGRVVAALGVDLRFDDYQARFDSVSQAVALGLAVLALASTLVGVLVYRSRQRLVAEGLLKDEALRQRAEALEKDRRLVSALGEIIYHFDPATNQITWSGDCERVLGWTSAEMPATFDDLRDRLHRKDRSLLAWKEADRGDAATAPLTREFRMEHKNGAAVWLLDRSIRTRDTSGRTVAVDGILLDISVRKRFEADLIAARDAAEAADRAKSDFLAVMSHEIRTPMNGVVGCANLLLETDVTPQQREFLETIRKCGDSLLHLINDILDFSKMESDKLSLERRPFSLKACVAEVLDLYGLMAAEKNIELYASFEDTTLDGIVGDEVRTRQILVNLVGNAIKFTSAGEVVVTACRKPWLPSGHGLMLSVRDTGIGIPADKQRTIFQPFSQADSSTTRRFGGTGLGLAICGRLATLMGGAITVHSLPGRGSDFVVFVPLEECELPNSPDFSPLRDVSVDLLSPNPGLLDALSVALVAAGCRVTKTTKLDASPTSWTSDFVVLDDRFAAEDVRRCLDRVRMQKADDSPQVVGLVAPTLPSEPPDGPPRYDHVLTKPLCADALARCLLGLVGPEVPALLRSIETGDLGTEFARRFPLRILIAEDNATNRKVIGHMLRRLGYEPELVENGRQCVEALERTEFDMVFMDVQMPEMDGYEATTTLRNRGNRVWITALTADAMPEDPLRCRIAGMNDYLSKPVRPQRLAEALVKCHSAISAASAR